MTTVEFWTNSKLDAVNALIKEYHHYASTEKDTDFAEMYDEDAGDFMQALSYFRQSDAEALAKHVCRMDTSPRESIVVAFHKDLGNQFVEEILGYELR